MLARAAVRSVAPSARLFSSSASRLHKVAVLGAGGGIGQPLSLLLKADPLVTSLSLYDIRGAPGVAADVSHIDTAGEVRFATRLCNLWCADVEMRRLPVTPLTSLTLLLRVSRLLSSPLVFPAR